MFTQGEPMIRRAAAGGIAIVLVLAACSSNEPPPPPPPPTQTTAPPTGPDTAAENAARRAAAEEAARRAEAERARLRTVLEQAVLFDYDQSRIRADAETVLQQKVPILRANPGVRLRIGGHADERGSVEYNLALGLRRANSVRDYLVNFGIDASRVTTETFGEDRPVDRGTTEAAYQRNRRAEFTITAGGENLVAPGG
jgi:peptidoglycan-associated lipoprotein